MIQNVLSTALIAVAVWAIVAYALGGPQWAAVGFAFVVYFCQINVPLWRQAASRE